MGFRFRKSVRIMPGVRLNLSKSGVSTSLGGKGFTANLSKRGIRGTASIPGTGLSYSSKVGGGGKKAASTRKPMQVEQVAPLSAAGVVTSDASLGAELPVTENSAMLNTIMFVGLIGPVVLASIAAGSFLGWVGWFLSLAFFGYVMLTLGRASVDAR